MVTGCSHPAMHRSPIPASSRSLLPTTAERAVADLLPIAARAADARTAADSVPLWFHTFAVDGVYTPGIARDHRYRLQAIPNDLSGARVLDVGTFDGFYAFLAERRGAARVVAVDNEQYVDWIASRFGIALEPGARVSHDRPAARQPGRISPPRRARARAAR